MNDAQLRDYINGLDVRALITTQRSLGRASLDPQFKTEWSGHYDRAVACLAEGRRSDRVRRLATLLKYITFSIAELNSNPVPTYYCYTDVPLLDWYLGQQRES